MSFTKKVYDIIQIEVSSSSSEQFIEGAVPNRVIKPTKTNIDIGWENCPKEKWKPELYILMALNMKNDNQFDDKSSLQASVLVFFLLSTKSYSVKLFTVSVSWLTVQWRQSKLAWIVYDLCVIDFDIYFKSH